MLNNKTAAKTSTRRVGAMIAVTATLLSTGLGAVANAEYEQCPDRSFCVWTSYDGKGRFAYFHTGSDDLARPISGYVFNNQIVSVWNRTDRRWCLYDDAGYRGSGVQVALDGSGNLPLSWQKRASSLRRVYDGIAC
jgi:hypothetical protein